MNQATLVTLTDALTLTFLLSVGAFILAMLLTPFYTFAAYRYKFWKKQRSASVDGEKLAVFNRLHANKIKRNIPTMAGVIGVASITVITLIFNRNRAETWLPLAALIGGGAVGILDDILNVRGHDAKVAGMRAGVKFTMITAIAIVLGMFFFSKLGYTTVHIPFFGDLLLGWLIVPLFAFAVVATSNAVNISDGLDGLAGGLLAVSFGTFGIIALLQGQVFLAGFCYTVVGALLSYLWFNIYPARFFMGDAGSFAFGTCLGVIAMMTNTLFLLPIIGAVFVVEAGSSLVQIVSKRVWHRKIFVSAPLHHHLEATGWPEVKVTMRFWVIGCITSFMGVLLALLGGHI